MGLRRIHLSLFTALAILSLPLQSAQAETWPSRPIRFIVPLPPGGAYDYIARLLANRLSLALGVPIVVENKPGASAQVGTEYVSRARADGYTFLVNANTHVILPSLFLKLPYDAIKDFEAVSLVVEIPFVLVVNPNVPVHSAKEFITLAENKQGSLEYGSSGIGSPFHLDAELLKLRTGTNILHVPYRGTGPLIQALLAGEVSSAFVPIGPYLQYINTGKLRPLALAGSSRSSLLPGVPTIEEAVPLPGYSMNSWIGVVAPAGTPKQIIERMNAEIVRVVKDEQIIKEQLLPQGYESVGSTSEHFMEVMKRDLAMYAKIVKDANIPPQ